jgi:hypothetical protein
MAITAWCQLTKDVYIRYVANLAHHLLIQGQIDYLTKKEQNHENTYYLHSSSSRTSGSIGNK